MPRYQVDKNYGGKNINKFNFVFGQGWNPLLPEEAPIFGFEQIDPKEIDKTNLNRGRSEVQVVASYEKLMEQLNVNIDFGLSTGFFNRGLDVKNTLDYVKSTNFTSSSISFIFAKEQDFIRKIVKFPKRHLTKEAQDLLNTSIEAFKDKYGTEYVNEVTEALCLYIVMTFNVSSESLRSRLRDRFSGEYSGIVTDVTLKADLQKDFFQARDSGSLFIQIYQSGISQSGGMLSVDDIVDKKSLMDKNDINEVQGMIQTKIKEKIKDIIPAVVSFSTISMEKALLDQKEPQLPNIDSSVVINAISRYSKIDEEIKRVTMFDPINYSPYLDHLYDYQEKIVDFLQSVKGNSVNLPGRLDAIRRQNEDPHGYELSEDGVKIHKIDPVMPIPQPYLGKVLSLKKPIGMGEDNFEGKGYKVWTAIYVTIDIPPIFPYEFLDLEIIPGHLELMRDIEHGDPRRSFSNFSELFKMRGIELSFPDPPEFNIDPSKIDDKYKRDLNTFSLENGNIKIRINRYVKSLMFSINTVKSGVLYFENNLIGIDIGYRLSVPNMPVIHEGVLIENTITPLDSKNLLTMVKL